MTEERLRTLFQASGTIVSARIVTDRETQRPKGFGFVEFEAPHAADAARGALGTSDLTGANS
jgi:nucleolin